jgi:hypothetical protein
LYRDDEKKRLRDLGYTRREANEASWELMQERFWPPDIGAGFYMTLATYPPPDVPQPTEPGQLPFASVWYGHCMLLACRGYLECQPPDFEGVLEVMGRAIEEAPDDSARMAAALAQCSPERFLPIVEKLFARETERHESSGTDGEQQVTWGDFVAALLDNLTELGDMLVLPEETKRVPLVVLYGTCALVTNSLSP